PKTEQAREAVENAVRTLAEQALASSVTISADAYKTVQAIIGEIDRKLSKKDLHRTLRRYKGVGWDQSPIFKKVYEAEYDQLGGTPYGCLVGDYYVDHSPPDVELM